MHIFKITVFVYSSIKKNALCYIFTQGNTVTLLDILKANQLTWAVSVVPASSTGYVSISYRSL